MAINLEKGQKISLEKEAGGSLTKVVMGLGWDAKQSGEKKGLLSGLFKVSDGENSIDLDASCIMFSGDKPVDAIFFGQLKSKDGSIIHSGDNRTGKGDGDDEQIVVDLSRVPENVTALVFTVNSFTGQTFDAVENAYCRLLDGNNQNEIARYTLTSQGAHTAQIMAKLYRYNGEWKMHAIGENATGRTINDLFKPISLFL
ncbi:MAG: TerD family protein [Methylococcales bacterium]|nr:TerD family protein [Methylococcales bacterium]MDD5753733.1 TerD family protein [Methylococcales bacterium]